MDAQTRYKHIQELLEVRIPKASSIVELGSAPGDQISQLARAGYACTSVDIGVASDSWATGEGGRMKKLLADAGVKHIEWNLEETPYPFSDAAFDAVIMTEVFEHLREYPIESLRESRRILKPGGMLFLTTPNQAYLMNRIRLLVGRNVQTPLRDWIAGLPFARHAREYTFAEMRELLQLAGFEVQICQSRHFHKHAGRRSLAARAAKSLLDQLSRLLPTFGPSIVIVARRTH